MGHLADVMTALKNAGIRTEAAYPGRVAMAVTESVAAVELEEVDYTAQKTVVLVTVLCPRPLGGAACASAAEKAGAALKAVGSRCVSGRCLFDSHGDVYYIPIRVTFLPEEMPEPEEDKDLLVQIGTAVLESAVSFHVSRASDSQNGVALEDAPWIWQLEEVFAPGEPETAGPESSFSLTVTRSAGTEVYSTCQWTSVRRETGTDRLRQVRTGTAAGRTYTAN